MVINCEESLVMVTDIARPVHGTRNGGQSGLIAVNSLDNTKKDEEVNAAMERYAAGDDSAFEQLYELLAPRLYGFLLRKTRNQTEAEDLLQQTLLRIHCARGRFIKGAQVMPWAISIARRLLIDRGRREKLQKLDESPENWDVRWAIEALECPADEALHAKEVVHMVQRVLSRLPDSQRAAFELVKQDGLSHADAAQVLGTSVTAVKLRAHRTYEALRTGLEKLLKTREL